MKISFTAVTAQHMLLLCVKMSRDNLNSAFGRLVLWCLVFDNKDAVGKTYPERMEWAFLQRLPSRLGCFWHTDICSRCFQLTVIMLKNKWIFFRISSTNIDVATVCFSLEWLTVSVLREERSKNWKVMILLKNWRSMSLCRERWRRELLSHFHCVSWLFFPGQPSLVASPRPGSQNGAWEQGQHHRLPTVHHTGCRTREKR